MVEKRKQPPGPRQRPPSPEHYDEVHDASEASFPASDPPSWTPVMGAGGPDRRADKPSGALREEEAKP
jgi:hypothetical protein